MSSICAPADGQFAVKVRMQAVDVRLLEKPARHAGLVGHNKDEHAGVVERLDRVDGAIDEVETLDRGDMAVNRG